MNVAAPIRKPLISQQAEFSELTGGGNFEAPAAT